MSNNRSVVPFAIGLFLSIFIFGWIPTVFAGRPAPETMAVTQSERPAVEVMFVLDTTSSMTGLIAAAKDKIWSIANTLASADPTPDIRMGLVGYRDRGDAYVTVFTPLSDDLDAVYARLMQFEAVGGGDTPESVNQALFEAVTKTDWNSSPAVYRVIFLVGDAPPKMNYPDDVKYVQSCARAVQNDIVINTVQCGNMPETAPIWRDIAQLGRGETFQVAQSGSAVLYETPFDEKIADMSRDLDDTRIYYGNAEQLREMEDRRKTADEIYSEARPSAVAKRTIFNSKAAGAKNFTGSQELVHAVEAGELDLAEVSQSDLPAELKGMSQPALAALIKTRSRERKQLQSQIEELAKKRQRFIEDKVRNEKDGGASSLDTKIYRCIQAQAAQKGIDYTHGPAY